jgi:hypothetical protein
MRRMIETVIVSAAAGLAVRCASKHQRVVNAFLKERAAGLQIENMELRTWRLMPARSADVEVRRDALSRKGERGAARRWEGLSKTK